MPPNDMPDHTQVNGTTKRTIQERVVAPVRNPSANCSNQAPFGGAVRSGAALDETSTCSEKRRSCHSDDRERYRLLHLCHLLRSRIGTAGRLNPCHGKDAIWFPAGQTRQSSQQ